MARCPFALWHPVGYDGGAYTGGPYRVVLHTTEGGSAAGALEIFKHHFAPQFVVDATTVYQLIDSARAGSAMQHNGEPQTNRLSAVQIEMVGYAERAKGLPLLTMTRKLLRWIETTHDVPRIWPNGPSKPAVNGHDPGSHNRSVIGWLKGGYFGHEHVPQNFHWDPALTADEQAFLMADEVSVPVVDKTYTIANGDTLTAIAKKFGTTVSVLAGLNSLTKPNSISIGQVLKLPA